jgi:hypothetical protein
MQNRMRELRTCGSVRGEGREVLAYSETVPRASLLILQLLGVIGAVSAWAQQISKDR